MPIFRRPSFAAPVAPSSGLGLDEFRQANPGVLAAFGGSLLGNNSSFGAGLQQAARLQQVNALRGDTAKYLLSKGLASNPAEALQLAGNDTLLKATLRKGGLSGDTTYGKTPIYGTDPETGKTVLGVVGDDGTFHKLDTGGFDVSTGIQEVDGGTVIYLYDKRSGQLIGTKPKDVAGVAEQTARGKGVGDAVVQYNSIKAKLPGLEKTVAELGGLAKQATYTLAGQAGNWLQTQAGFGPSAGQVARTKYEAIINNQILPLLRDTFGAQFTEREGDTLRNSLGDTNKTPEEKQAVLDAFIEQKKRDIEALRQQANPGAVPPPADQGSPNPGDVVDGYRFKGGDPSDQRNWEPAQ